MRRIQLFGISLVYWLILLLGVGGVLGLHSDSGFATQPAITVAQAAAYSPRTDDERAALEAYQAAARNAHPNSNPATVTRLVLVGDYALLDWVYSEMGGQAVLTKRDGSWRLIRGVGGLFSVPSLMQLGVPERDARNLMSAYRNR